MKLRKIIVEACEVHKQPKVALIAGIDLLRGIHQGEFATIEGTMASYAAWRSEYGIETPEKVLKWFEPQMELEIPEAYLVDWLKAGWAELKGI